ncbi:NAD-dependent epimerase/dehydratase family protein [Sulfurimonas sp.]|uniref:NAD-dependent epimerase/dehydratase family protein n=1 Tax=Sulfurimonas sp. TaxID=2022749 RepID=UPI003D1037C6
MNLIIGKNGFIAQKLGKSNKYDFTSSNQDEQEAIYLNLSEAEKFNYDIIKNDTNIIFLAAISSPDECNNNYEGAYKINVRGTIYFIKEALKRRARVLFFSSDVVYGDTVNEVNENSQTSPFGNYAKMKDKVEKTFFNKKNFKVFRLSYVLSNEDKYLSYLKNCIDKNEIAEVFHPFSRKVVFIEDVLEAIENIFKKWNEFDNQKFNICGEFDVSRKDIADFYNKAVGDGLNYNLLKPDEKFWEARPKDINITSLYLEKLLNRKPVTIEDAINKIVKGK